MQPEIHLNWLAVLASVVASFALGSLWYGPLFSNVWANAMGFGDAKPTGAEIARGSILNLVGTFLMAYVLAHDVLVWRPSTWKAGVDSAPHVYGFFAGLFVWIGFVVPILCWHKSRRRIGSRRARCIAVGGSAPSRSGETPAGRA
jgi:hypothetical protein